MANQVGSIDFMSDQLSMAFMSDQLNSEKTFLTVNAMDDDNLDGLSFEVDTSLTSSKVGRVLEQIIEWRGKPAALGCDHGPEYLSQTLVK